MMRDEFSTYLGEAQYGQRIIITRNGKQVAALIPIKDLNKLENINDKESAQLGCDGI